MFNQLLKEYLNTQYISSKRKSIRSQYITILLFILIIILCLFNPLLFIFTIIAFPFLMIGIAIVSHRKETKWLQTFDYHKQIIIPLYQWLVKNDYYDEKSITLLLEEAECFILPNQKNRVLHIIISLGLLVIVPYVALTNGLPSGLYNLMLFTMIISYCIYEWISQNKEITETIVNQMISSLKYISEHIEEVEQSILL